MAGGFVARLVCGQELLAGQVLGVVLRRDRGWAA
ncbi:hypothetical protein STVIR_0027 [Streptomyces viridochromogenes Tue57]|uniref:Uncharacterized protein n=1 Tax=Streptomyces viridochromogenes Tue57 TaxID=1160705 RepID=L8PSP9_STRVR|nr:hypothetical protein STVIR_0027 [Streptomyces viridochromogenes Tue57]